ncbi:MAG: hypothetical protein LUD16_12860 [Lachnospiraceae bacterium]|nr:hypothetical protein [Lachnospiraceae bacterium]
MTIEEIIARQRELLNLAQGEGRALTDEERNEFDSLQRALESMRTAPGGEGGGAVGGQAAGADGGNSGDGGEDSARQIETERNRIRQIEDLCREFHMDDQARGFIDNGSTLEQVRAAVIEHMRQTGAPVHTSARITDSAEDKFRRAASDSILMRAGIKIHGPRRVVGRRFM